MQRHFSSLKSLRRLSLQARTRYDSSVWRKGLLTHPDRRFVDYVLKGVSQGFSIERSAAMPDSNSKNLPTSTSDKVKISEWILNGISEGYIIGQLEGQSMLPQFHVSPVVAVPKSGNRIRPIHHLSAPRTGVAVNSEIHELASTVTYTSLSQVITLAKLVGADCLMWNADAENAYLNVPVRPSDWKYLGLKWCGKLFAFTCLLFGLSSAPKIYTDFADAIEWCVTAQSQILFYTSNGDKLVFHYLDDFFGGSR